MNGDMRNSNGDRLSNGFQPRDAAGLAPPAAQFKQAQQQSEGRSSIDDLPAMRPNGTLREAEPPSQTYGPHMAKSLGQAPPEILDLIPKDNYLPMAALISRASQACWRSLTEMVDQLASMHVADQPGDHAGALPNGLPNNQTKINLDKKDRLLKFANDQKADFIKLLVLLQWSKDVDDVSKTISINFWLMKRREAYWNAVTSMAQLMQEAAGFQIPNPDLKTAAEVLSRRKALGFPSLGYLPSRPLSNRQIIRLLKSLNHRLCVRLALTDDVPVHMRHYRIHDGRATFTVPREFELDVSVLDDRPDSPFRMVDFRLTFSPSPTISDQLHAEIERYANSNIDRDGLQGCFHFLHELALSYKLAEVHRQALELSRSYWTGNLRVELLRRTLVVQYWTERIGPKSWIEVGIASGRGKDRRQRDALPSLQIRWMHQGKQDDDSPRVHLDHAVLSFDQILRQLMARHATRILDSIYDKLILSPLFAQGQLAVAQAISDDDPDGCSLAIQLSKTTQLQLKIDAVSGTVVLSPASDRSERLQHEINRALGVADETVSKLVQFRCSIAEAAILACTAGTRWEILRAVKLAAHETKALFGVPVMRTTFLRVSCWGLGYCLAVTNGPTGDYWWLLRQASSSADASAPQFRVLRSQQIEVGADLSAAFFEHLADYATGLISIQGNLDFLKMHQENLDDPVYPNFQKIYHLPELSFDIDLARPLLPENTISPMTGPRRKPPAATRETAKSPAPLRRCITVQFGGIDRTTDLVTTVARFRSRASLAQLKYFDQSVLDEDVTLSADDGLVTIRLKSPVTEPAMLSIIDKAKDLEQVVSAVAQIDRLPGVKLKSLSKSTFTIIYGQAPPVELGLTITFGPDVGKAQLDFFPKDTNPHNFLSSQYTNLLSTSRMPFTIKVRDFLTSLTLTLPLLTFLNKIQQRQGPATDQSAPPTSAEVRDQPTVHILVRSAMSFAVQYFMPPAPSADPESGQWQRHLLARLEILPHLNASKKPMWIVRAALEEFQSYSRPSYSSPELKVKLRQQIYAKSAGQRKWLALDNAAACMADQPEELLQAIHDLMFTWATQVAISQRAEAAMGSADATPGTANALPNGVNKSTPSSQAQPAPGGITNGPAKQSQSQRGGHPRATGGRAGPGKPALDAAAAKREATRDVITLD